MGGPGLFGCAFAAALLAVGCGSPSSSKGLLGTYQVMIASGGLSDADVLTIAPGASGTVLLTFVAGISTDPAGPDADGLRATLPSSTAFALAAQPARIDRPTGPLDGTLQGSGTVQADGTLAAALHFVGGGVASDYTVSGTRQ